MKPNANAIYNPLPPPSIGPNNPMPLQTHCNNPPPQPTASLTSMKRRGKGERGVHQLGTAN